jgi:DNA end-binding protein Ku
MDASERVAIGRFVMRTKEYLTAIRARDGALELTTMLFHDEVRPTKPIPTGGKKPTKTQLDNAVAIIEELATEWEPERYEDCYRERLMKVIQRKRKRQTIEAPKPEPEPAPVDDLMAALKASLDNVKAGRDARFTKDEEKAKA